MWRVNTRTTGCYQVRFSANEWEYLLKNCVYCLTQTFEKRGTASNTSYAKRYSDGSVGMDACGRMENYRVSDRVVQVNKRKHCTFGPK